MVIIIIIILIIVFVLLSYSIFHNVKMISSLHENMESIGPDNLSYQKDLTCKYQMSETVKKILDKNKIVNNKNDDWTIYLPCTYNNIKEEIDKIKPTRYDQRIFIINNADQISSKNELWKNLKKTYGRDKAKLISPNSYILNDDEDMKLFEKEYDPNKIYIMKKNIQRQEGLKITKNKDQIITGAKDGYVIVQELLQDPYIIGGRKTNVRFYLLIVCQNNEISAYVHSEGFMYYTKTPFIKGSTSDDPNITTGYVERYVYKINPLTHGDLRKYLDNPDRKLSEIEQQVRNRNQKISEVVFNRIYKMLSMVVYAVKDQICQNSHLKPYITFQLFGCDVAFNDQLLPMIIEVNKGPDLGAKDDRDSKIKLKVVDDILKIIKVKPDFNNEFIKIADLHTGF